MPKVNRTSYSTDSIQAAVSAVRKKQLSTRKAAIEFGVPRTTLQRHISHCQNKIDLHDIGRKRALSNDDEDALSAHLMYMASQGVPATRGVVRQKVREIVALSGKDLTT